MVGAIDGWMDRLSRALLCPNCRFPSWVCRFVQTPAAFPAPFAPAAMVSCWSGLKAAGKLHERWLERLQWTLRSSNT